MALDGTAFHGKLEFRQRVIPLPADQFQRTARLVQLRGLELPQSFPPYFNVAHQPRGRQHSQMLVMACREMSVPEVSCVMDMAPPTHRAAMSRSRISSPNAAKIGA